MKYKWLMILTVIMALAIAAYLYLKKKGGPYLVTEYDNIIVYWLPDTTDQENIAYSGIKKNIVLGRMVGETSDFYEFEFENSPYESSHYVRKSDVTKLAAIGGLKDDLTIFTV